MDDSYIFIDQPGLSAGVPALFLFHGTGGDEHQFLDLAAQLVPGARLIAPRGDVSEHGAARYFRRLAEGRYDMADLSRATGKLSRFVDERLATSAPDWVGALGYSNGANILASLLFSKPDRIDRAVLMHPLIPFAPAPQPGLKGKEVLITAGRRDPMAAPGVTDALATYLREQGAEVTLTWHEGGHEIRQEELLAARQFLSAAR